MSHLRKYGRAPFSTVVLHGGPGAAGEMMPVAEELGNNVGTLEPFQTKKTIPEQVKELHEVLVESADVPVNLIGYSWGAWLAWIFAATCPFFVKKLILISSGPFDSKYVPEMEATRMSRFSERDKLRLNELQKEFESPQVKDKTPLFKEFGEIFGKADSFSPLESLQETKLDFDIYNSIWPEAEKLRESGELLKYAERITCPVVAIHGDYDPHPWKGVKEPLEKNLKKFKFILLEKCGHTPWLEEYAQDDFYYALLDQLS